MSVKRGLTWSASLFQELDLEQKIELEIKMREGSAKLLAASKQQAQSLEAARALLTSNERMSAYMAELQRRKRDPQIRCVCLQKLLSLLVCICLLAMQIAVATSLGLLLAHF